MSSRNRKPTPPTKMRGPSRPVDPRYAPGRPARKGPDRFGIGLIAISTLVALLAILYVSALNSNGTTTLPVTTSTTSNPAGQTGDPIAKATETAVAFATQVAPLPRILPGDAKALQASNNVKIIDVRAKAQYDKQHIKGAINVPHDQAPSRVKEFPAEGNIVVYCQ